VKIDFKKYISAACSALDVGMCHVIMESVKNESLHKAWVLPKNGTNGWNCEQCQIPHLISTYGHL
jgi:Zn-finger protein